MKKAMYAAGVILLLAAFAQAQDAKPNFSGTWRLDAAKSDFGPMPPPESIVHVIEHKEPNVKITSTQKGPQGETTSERTLTTDGKENTNKMRLMGGEQEAKSTSQWDGKKLGTLLKVDIQGTAVTFTDSWELSDEGKVLTIVRVISS